MKCNLCNKGFNISNGIVWKNNLGLHKKCHGIVLKRLELLADIILLSEDEFNQCLSEMFLRRETYALLQMGVK